MSANTGVAPVYRIALAVATNVRDGADVLREQLLQLLRSRSHAEPSRAIRLGHGLDLRLADLDVGEWNPPIGHSSNSSG